MSALLIGWEPFFREGNLGPELYDFIENEDFEGYWSELDAERPNASSRFSPSAKDLFLGMVHADPTKRLTIDQVINHEWFKGDTATVAEVRAQLQVCLNKCKNKRQQDLEKELRQIQNLIL